MAPSKTRVPFGVCFLTMTTAAALLLTWSLWWLVVVGHSVPARRPFYRKVDQLPPLIQDAAEMKSAEVFEFALHGGWPRANSAARLLASVVAVGASFSFAYIAALLPERVARGVFCGVLSVVACLALGALVMDTVSVVRTSRECSSRKCRTAVPQAILDAASICKCSTDAWFYLTLFVDVLLMLSAVVCLFLTLMPLFRGEESEEEPAPPSPNGSARGVVNGE